MTAPQLDLDFAVDTARTIAARARARSHDVDERDIVRLLRRVRVNPTTGCWVVMHRSGGRPVKRYADLKTHSGVRVAAHRFMCSVVHGSLPPEVEACHSCDNPPCVCPDHLVPGTQSENIRDCVAKGRYAAHRAEWTHCPKGHEYTPENTRRQTGGHRLCAACERVRRREISRRYRERVKADPARNARRLERKRMSERARRRAGR